MTNSIPSLNSYRTCWVCMTTFNSRNRLFRHLNLVNHDIDQPDQCCACGTSDFVELDNHCFICKNKGEFSIAYYYKKGYQVAGRKYSLQIGEQYNQEKNKWFSRLETQQIMFNKDYALGVVVGILLGSGLTMFLLM